MVPSRKPDRFATAVKALEAASYVGGLVSLALIAIQLTKDASERRAQASFEFVRQFNSPPMTDHRRILLRGWLPYAEELERIGRQGMPRREIDALTALVATESDRKTDDGFTIAVHEIADFYYQMSICVGANTCDPRVIDAYFSGYGRSFACLYRPLVHQQAVALGTPELERGTSEYGRPDRCEKSAR